MATKDDLKKTEEKTEVGFKRLEEKMVTMMDNLAVAVAKGFEETATKEEVKAVEKRLDKLEEGQGEIKAQIIFMKDDAKNLKADTPSLSQYNNHEKRINKLESSVFA